MKPATAESLLTWLLRLDGLVMSTAILAVFFPDALMHWIHARLTLGEMPTDPVTEYLARSCAALYALHGCIVLLLGVAPRQYWQLVRWVLLLHLCLGILLFGIDLNAGMPWFWTAGEGLPIAGLATLMIWLWYRAGRSAPAVTRTG